MRCSHKLPTQCQGLTLDNDPHDVHILTLHPHLLPFVAKGTLWTWLSEGS